MAKGTIPAVDVAKEQAILGAGDNVRTLATGVRARLRPVAASLIDEVTIRVPDPVVPMWHNEEKDRDEPNPTDPAYLKDLETMARQRGLAGLDAMIMFGVELVEAIPDDGWERRLKFLGIEFDAQDDFEREFYYKKYVAISNEDVALIGALSGVNQEAVNQAVRSFRGQS